MKVVRSIKPENQIKRRIKELNSIFSAMDEDHKKVVTPLIDFAAHMEANIRKLDKDLEEVGFVEEYSNGVHRIPGLLHHDKKLYRRYPHTAFLSS